MPIGTLCTHSSITSGSTAYTKKATPAPPLEGEKTELGSELLSLVHDSEKTLSKASEQLSLQGEQIDSCMATMYDIHEDLKISENLVTGLESWMGQWSAIKKAEHDADTVVITNKDIPNVYEYEVLYWKVDASQTPLHPCKDGIFQVSRETIVLMTPLQVVVESYKWEDISRVRILNPWEIQLSQYRIGEPDVNYVLISVHGYKLVKKSCSTFSGSCGIYFSKTIWQHMYATKDSSPAACFIIKCISLCKEEFPSR